MPDDSDFERPVRGSRWSDSQSRAALQAIAEDVAEIAGFDLVGISAARDDGYLHTLAIVGPEDAREVLLDSLAPTAPLLDQLEHADDWGGALKFVPHDRLVLDIDKWGWASDAPREDLPPGTWHPDDMLVATLEDDDGEFIGFLGMELPRDGMVPSAEKRTMLEAYARQATTAIRTTLERERLAEQIRLTRAAADIVRRASGSMSAAEVLEECGAAIADGFRAEALWTQLVGEEPRAVHDSSPVPPPPALAELLPRYAAAAWAQQQVGVFAPERPAPPPLSDSDAAAVLEFLASTGGGAESMLLAPLGAGPDYLGWIALTRAAGGAEWSEGETEVALDIGRDLGRALANAANYEREHRLVQELQELADYKSHLIATVSHELRTPLTSIIGFLEILDGDPALSDHSRTAVDAIQRGSLRLARVVEELLVLHRVVDSELDASMGVDLARLLAECVALHQGPAAGRRITVVGPAPDPPIIVLGVEHELEHVVANLVGNAVKYTPDGGNVTVTLEVVDGVVVLTCTDDGIGISEADQAHVFDEFYRSPDPDAAYRSGTGLGLAIVRRVVDRHGGSIELESTLGRGSTFRVTLPAG